MISRRSVLRSLLSTAALLLSHRSAAARAGAALTPEAFGAKGDGRTDDTEAFLRLSAALQARGGGDVAFRAGAVYSVGRQSAPPGGPLTGAAVLSVSGVARFVVQMNGATIRFRSGLRFGTFDVATGARKDPVMPHLDPHDRADAGIAIRADKVGFFSVSGGTIDCNSRGMHIGGTWGDVGWQAIHYGIFASGCDRVEWTDLEVKDSCLDGLCYGYPGLTSADTEKPLVMRRVNVSRVGRNCLTITGTNSALVEDCTFERAGEAPVARGGILRSSPASCLDIEAEQSTCRNIVIRRCKLLSGRGTNTAVVADSGPSRDILLDRCVLSGAVWAAKPGVRFSGCTLYGYFAKLAGGFPHAADNSVVVGCAVNDVGGPAGYVTKYPLVIDLEGAGPGVRVTESRIAVTRTRLNLRNGILRGVAITFATGTDVVANRDFAILADGASLEDVTISERILVAKQPADAFYVTAPKSAVRSSIVSADSKLLWNGWSRPGGGHAGKP